ncbi:MULTISPECIES: hypothetical protein [Streptomyces]|uniref:hypothetical protein n=1 Tax=Streptomyces TaxID=1883 RepID=UPI0016789D8D
MHVVLREPGGPYLAAMELAAVVGDRPSVPGELVRALCERHDHLNSVRTAANWTRLLYSCRLREYRRV